MDIPEIISKSIWLLPLAIFVFELVMKNIKKKTAPVNNNIPHGAEEAWHNDSPTDQEFEQEDIQSHDYIEEIQYDSDFDAMILERKRKKKPSFSENLATTGVFANISSKPAFERMRNQNQSSQMIREMLKDRNSIKKAVILQEVLNKKY